VRWPYGLAPARPTPTLSASLDAGAAAVEAADSHQSVPDPEEQARRSRRDQSQPLERFEDTIATAESARGPFDPSLIEVLLDFARYQSELGQHTAAVELYERALAITRISHGLHSAQQGDVLPGLIDAHIGRSQQWDLADDRARSGLLSSEASARPRLARLR